MRPQEKIPGACDVAGTVADARGAYHLFFAARELQNELAVVEIFRFEGDQRLAVKSFGPVVEGRGMGGGSDGLEQAVELREGDVGEPGHDSATQENAIVIAFIQNANEVYLICGSGASGKSWQRPKW